MSPEERRLKTIIWNNLNKDWLKEQAEKKKKNQEEQKHQNTPKKRKRKKAEQNLGEGDSGPTTAYEAVLKSSKFQNINPKIFESMFTKK